tara:strand:- start:76 stop:264 length:189 start_codon:yes stop_codon:yes gene_type:complete
LKSGWETELRYVIGPYTIPPFKNLPSDARMVKLVDTRDLKSKAYVIKKAIKTTAYLVQKIDM